jgi:hypothetical protein
VFGEQFGSEAARSKIHMHWTLITCRPIKRAWPSIEAAERLVKECEEAVDHHLIAAAGPSLSIRVARPPKPNRNPGLRYRIPEVRVQSGRFRSRCLPHYMVRPQIADMGDHSFEEGNEHCRGALPSIQHTLGRNLSHLTRRRMASSRAPSGDGRTLT